MARPWVEGAKEELRFREAPQFDQSFRRFRLLDAVAHRRLVFGGGGNFVRGANVCTSGVRSNDSSLLAAEQDSVLTAAGTTIVPEQHFDP
jgi:hypothetical protein